MKKLEKLIVVSERYPTAGDPVFTFVDELLVQLNALGVDIQVVSPASATRGLLKGNRRAAIWRRDTPQGGFTVRQRPYFTTGTLMPGLNHALYRRAVAREIEAIIGEGFIPDAIYAHFWRSGIDGALAAGDRYKVFIACGESTVKPELAHDARRITSRLGGVISVSTRNLEDCERLYGTPRELMTVLPNGVDGQAFRPLTAERRAAEREKLGLAADDFAVAFVGWFNERKGVKRVEEALKGLERVKALYIGNGELTPEGENIAFCGRVAHRELPNLLGATDVFVLPTLAEGCCNAIVEAMACGLPIISSKGAFNDDLLSEKNSLRVDPMSASEIRQAVIRLRDNEALRGQMGAQALAFAQGLDVGRRARRIKAFIEERL